MLREHVATAVVSLIKFVICAFLWQRLLFDIGRITLLLFTFGRYPRGRDDSLHENRIAAVGVAVLLAVWSTIAIYNNVHPYAA